MNKHFCPAPWLTFFTQPNGEVYNCCIARTKLGHINKNTIEQIIQGSDNLEVKRKMLAGESVEGCQSCHGKKDSLQKEMLELFKNIPLDFYHDINNFQLKYFDARMSNTCNFACVYCNSNFSSTWAAELGNYHEIKLDKKEKNYTKKYLLDNVHDLEYVYLAGGEPLMIKENELLLSAIAEHGKNVKKILVNTNLSIIENNQIFDVLVKIPETTWLVSVDAMEIHYEYIRYPGNWGNFKSNLLHLKEIFPREKIGFNMVFCALNVMHIWDTIDWLIDQGFYKFNIAITPYNSGVDFVGGFLDVRVLSDKTRAMVLDKIESNSEYSSLTGIADIKKILQHPRLNDFQIENTIRCLKELDQRRGLNSRQVFPEIYKDLEPKKTYREFRRSISNLSTK